MPLSPRCSNINKQISLQNPKHKSKLIKMADAMSYEYLLRRIYQVGRYGKKDVDADVYRSFEHAERLYTLEQGNIAKGLPRIDNRSITQLETEYRVGCKHIWLIIAKALKAGYEKFGHQFTSDQKQIFEHLFVEPKELTKDHLDQVIDTAESIFVKYKIYPA